MIFDAPQKLPEQNRNFYLKPLQEKFMIRTTGKL